MKLQCSCGAKYAFDATPEMLQNPIKFICPACGLDASAFVNELIRQEFAGPVPPAAAAPQPLAPPPAPRIRISHEGAPAAPAPAPAAAAPPPPPVPSEAPRMRIAREAAPAAAASSASGAGVGSKMCSRHHERATEQCAVCQKPICPKCLVMFGFFCSPHCKSKAEEQGMNVPVYAGQRDQADAAAWRRTGLIVGGIIAVIVLLIGVWTWYCWYGSVAHPYFAVRFEDNDRAYSGHAQLAGKDQLVFLHGGTLARYDLKSKKPVWTQQLITQQQIDDEVKAQMAEEERIDTEMSGGYHHKQSSQDIGQSVKEGLQTSLALHISGQDIWIENGTNLIHYDWNNGSVVKTVPLPDRGGDLVEADGELQVIDNDAVTHISLASGDSHTDQFGPPGARRREVAEQDSGNGLPGVGGDPSKPLDARKVEAQAANLKVQGRIALPALIGNARHEKEIENALNADIKRAAVMKGHVPVAPTNEVFFELVVGKTGYAQFASRLLEERIVEKQAMKEKPKKSALDGTVNAAHEGEILNDVLNDIQRTTGGDTVTEDESRYSAMVHLPEGTTPDWKGEVIGEPKLFVLKTVNVVAGGKMLIVLDKSNKEIWHATLTFALAGGSSGLEALLGGGDRYGEGPLVEHGDTLYVSDQAVLTAFNLKTVDAQWRLPSVGVVGLFFDDKDFVYVNTTTASPDQVKYSRQVDVTRNTQQILLKVDPKSGKTIWGAEPGGFISYLSGKYIYAIDSYDPNPDDEESSSDMTIQKPAFLRITRIRPSDGRVLWDYYDRARAPRSWHFDGNSIELVFKREVQVLRYLSF